MIDLDRDNTSPADELLSVRERIKELQVREKDLKATLIADPDARMGRYAVASVVESERVSIDTKRLKEEYPDLADSYSKSTVTTTVKVMRHATEEAA